VSSHSQSLEESSSFPGECAVSAAHGWHQGQGTATTECGGLESHCCPLLASRIGLYIPSGRAAGGNPVQSPEKKAEKKGESRMGEDSNTKGNMRAVMPKTPPRVSLTSPPVASLQGCLQLTRANCSHGRVSLQPDSPE